MIAHLGLRTIGQAIGDGAHDRGMIADDLLRFVANRQMQAADAIDVPAAIADQHPEVGHARRIEQHVVKGEIRFVEALEVLLLRVALLLVDDGLKPFDQRGIGRGRERAHHLLLERPAQELRLARQRHVDQADDRAALRKHLDQSRLFEPHQGVADRRRAHAELRLQPQPRQRRPRRKLQRQDHVAQLVEHLGRRLLRPDAGLRIGQCHHGALALRPGQP